MRKKKKFLLPYILFVALIFVIALNIFLYFKPPKIQTQNIIVVEISGFGSTNVSEVSKEENITFRPTEILVNCSKDEDCDWIIVNCCREDLGAQWQCLNKNSYIDCLSKLVLCPNISIPKPKEECKCIDNICTGQIFIVTE